MDLSTAQRRRNRRAQSHSSRENLVKDSSSDVSPRDSSAPTVADRRRQRRRQVSGDDQQHVNPAFAADEDPVVPSRVERANLHDDDADEEEEEQQQKVKDADRLTSHVEKEHARKMNELKQQRRQGPSKALSSEAENEQEDVEAQLREQQQRAARKVEKADVDDTVPVEPISIPTGTSVRERSLDKVLERARRARGATTQNDEAQSTMGSSRRFGGTSDSRLQKILGHRDSFDPTLKGTMTRGDRSTRFDMDDYDPRDEARIRQDIDQKQGERSKRWQEVLNKLGTSVTPSEQDDFFIKVWPEEKPRAATGTEEPADGTEPTAATTDESTTNRERPAAAEERVPLLPSYGEAPLVQYQRAEREFDDDEERILENRRYKYVVGENMTWEQKFGQGATQLRSLEDEGFFVGKKPIVPKKLIQRAEQRIIQEHEYEKKSPDHWFGPDGSIVALPNPTKFVPTRPLIDELFDPALGKEFYKAYTIDNQTGGANDPIGAERYRLDIDIGSITFFHHHLMSVEHVFAMRMKQMYENYVIRRQQRRVQQLNDRIKALKSAEKQCKDALGPAEGKYSDSVETKELRERLKTYRNELRQARNERCNEMKLERQLLQNLLNTWKRIKDIRRQEGCTNTPLRLIIKQISGKKNNHYEQMKKQIEDEIEDEIELEEEKYQKALAEYKAIQKRRKLQGIRKDRAKEQIKRKQESARTTDDADDVDYDQADIDALNEEDIVVPDKPEKRNEDDIRTAIQAKYQNAIRPADEPEIILELVYSEPVSTDSECPARERARRYAVQSTSNLSARILINDKVIANTTNIPLSSDFEGQFNQIFPCYIVRTPDTIKLEIYETANRSRLLAELYLAVPETSVTTDTYQLQPVEFSSNAYRKQNPSQTTAVGAGVPVPNLFDDLNKSYWRIEGSLRVAAAWGVQDGVPLVPTDYATSKAHQNQQISKQELNMQGAKLGNMKSLIQWIKQSNLDPYDPDNAFLINLMKDYTNSEGEPLVEVNTYQHFRLSTDEASGIDSIENPVDIDSSLRFKLLQARRENIPAFKDGRRVPPYDYLVRRNNPVFQAYLRSLTEVVDDDDFESYTDKRKTRIDLVRRQGERQLRKMREQVNARYTVAKSRKTLQQVVVEESIPNIQALRVLLAKITIEPNRPLYPVRRQTEQKKVTNIAITANKDVFILVNLIGAVDLPVRRLALENSRTNQQKSPSDRVTLVRPYVEIQFQKKTYRTSTVDGPNPSWNEEIRIPFRPPDNDFEPSALQKCRDVLYINIFDQMDVDLPSSDRHRDQVIYKRISRNWLGSVKIPFSNLYINGRLEGSYRLNVPSPLLGYTRERLNQSNPPKTPLPLPASVLRMFVTMEPILAPPEAMQQSFDSTESLELLNHARSWVEQLSSKFPTRDFKATVSDTNGRAVFIPRFIRPLPLPPSFQNDGSSGGAGGDIQSLCQRLARFVSLIPFISDSVSFAGSCDIWETSDQFLKTMAGDDEEHAVLLNNYFRTLNRKSYLAYGVSIYSGPCWFVLTITDGERYPTCWSVADGHDASTMDNWNPIRSIYMLISEDNIWANIQEQDLPSRMIFDVENTSCWKSFFGGQLRRDALTWASVQPNDLQYDSIRGDDVHVLETHIKEVIRQKIIEWREPNMARWSYRLQRKLEEHLKQEEGRFISGRTTSMALIEDELRQDFPNEQIIAFPIQMPYTNIRTIVETVYATKVFEHPTADIEFCLAVHLHSYTNNILAVWIYLGHVTKKN